MRLVELFLLALAVSADAFAVALSIGLACAGAKKAKSALATGAYFGGFQALMPVVGFFAATHFTQHLGFEQFIVAGLLGFLGIKMVLEARKPGTATSSTSADTAARLSPLFMLPLAFATSVDALAVGISLAFLNANIFIAAAFIGGITFICSALGVALGGALGCRHQKKATLAGGLILIGIGLRVLFF